MEFAHQGRFRGGSRWLHVSAEYGSNEESGECKYLSLTALKTQRKTEKEEETETEETTRLIRPPIDSGSWNISYFSLFLMYFLQI